MRTVIVIGLLVTAAAVGYAYHHRARIGPTSAFMKPQPRSAVLDRVAKSQPGGPPRAAPPSSRVQEPAQANRWSRFQSLLPKAGSGDAKAQFQLWQLAQECRFHRYGSLLQEYRAGKLAPLSLQEALDKAARYGYDPQDVATFYEGCRPFVTEKSAQPGLLLQWLQKSSDAGYPPAQANAARLSLRHQQERDTAKVIGLPVEDAPVPRVNGEQVDERALLRDALRRDANDGEILDAIGNLQRLLNPQLSSQEVQVNHWAWAYLACQKMTNCAQAYGEPVKGNCAPHDDECTGVPAQMLQAVNNDWTPVARRIEEIQSALASQQWDQMPGLDAR